jgi:hypothetical protein
MRIILAAAAALSLTAAAFAQTTTPPVTDNRGACRAEVQTLCGAAQGQGREAMRACLEEKRSQLSPACQEAAVKAKGKAKAKKGEGQRSNACAADIERLCNGVQPGEGRIMQCLQQKETELSQQCRDGMAMAKAKKGG